MNKIISTIKGFGKAKYVLLAIGAFAFIAIGVSSGAQPAKSDTCTQIAVPQTPAFNVWPLTFDNTVPCADLPMIDAADSSSTGRNARFSQSQAEHDAGIQANPGDYVTISVYFHNGATPDTALLAQTTAQNVQVSSSYNAGAATTHTFSASISTSNGAGASSSDPARGGNITVNTSVPTTIVYVPGSTSMSGGSGNRSLPDGIANGSIGLGSIMACWNYSGTVQYQVQVVAVPIVTPTPTPPATCTASNTPSVTGEQGFNVATNAYTSQVYPNNYLVVYGNNFGSSPALSGLPPGATESYESNNQINIQLGSYTGAYSITIANGSCAGTATGSIAAAVVVTPTPTPPATCTASNTPVISGQQGFNNTTGIYSTPIYASNYLVIYGSNFGASPVVTGLPSGASVSYVSNTQINVLLGSYVGAYTITVANGSCTGTAASTIVAVATTPPPATYAQLQINKLVEDQNYATAYAKSVNAYPGDVVKFQITVVNVGTATATSAYVLDPIPAGLTYVSGTTTVNGTAATDITSGSLSLGNMAPNQQDVVVFSTTVANSGTTGSTIQNTAVANASNAYQVQSSASVFVQGQSSGTVNLTQSKSAYNNSLGVNATTQAAQPGNLITYTLNVTNSGTAQATGYVVSDDLSNVLQFATLVSPNGGSLNGSAITWPAVNIAPGTSVSDTFKVQVNNNTSFYGNSQMVNTFGNTVVIPLGGVQPIYVQPQPVVYSPQPVYVQQQPQPVYVQAQQPTVIAQQPLLQVQQPQVLGATFVAPKTGADADVAYAFAGLITTGTAAIRKRNWLTRLFKK